MRQAQQVLNCELGEEWGKFRLSSDSSSSPLLLESGCGCSVVVGKAVF